MTAAREHPVTITGTSRVQLGATLAIALAVLTLGQQLAKAYGDLEAHLARIDAQQAATARELEQLRAELTDCRSRCSR